jgi:hypothetical protein
MATAQPQTEEVIYFGHQFSAIKIGEKLYKVVSQISNRVAEVEHDPVYAIEVAKQLDMRAGWEDIDEDYN